MKKIFTAALIVVMLLSMIACGNNAEKTRSYYVVTSEKHYWYNKLTSSAEFTYDKKGRPLTMKIEMVGERVLETELTYDKNGNKIREVFTHTDLKTGLTSTTEENYKMTYQDGKLTHCDIVDQNGDSVGFDLQYDEKGRLIRVDYNEAYTNSQTGVWHTYEYDAQGRLIQEALCRKMRLSQESTPLIMETVTQMRYQYGQNNNVFYTEYSGSVCYVEGAERIPEPELTKTDWQINYCFDDGGKVIYVGTSEEDVYEESYGTLKDNDRYTFDDHGNLLSYDSGAVRVEYTYEKRDLTEMEVEMANRLTHGISMYMSSYMMFGKMDPTYVDVAPITYYVPYLRNPVYYLVPCPLWYMPSK